MLEKKLLIYISVITYSVLLNVSLAVNDEKNIVDACKICNCSNSDIDCSFKKLSEPLNVTLLETTEFHDVLFDYNQIVHLRPFPLMTAKKLSFRHNYITAIDKATFRLVKNLTEIDLSHNHLTSHVINPHIFMGSYSPETYEPLTNLEILRLSGNSLHTLHPDVFEHLPVLKVLSLNSNPLIMIDRPTSIALASLLHLEDLDLSSTQIRQLPATLLHTLRFLQKLDLSNNQLTSIPKSLSEAEYSLRELILDNNPIIEVDCFPTMKNLEVLHMNNMPKLELISSGALRHLPSLKELSIAYNPKLMYIAEDSFTGRPREGCYFEKEWSHDWPPITKLYLNNNKLKHIGQEFIARWDNIEQLDVAINPWICDCENQWFLSTLMPNLFRINKNVAEEMLCEEPDEMRGRSLMELSRKKIEMRCLDSRGSKPERDSIILVAVFIGILIAIPLAMASFALYQRTYGYNSPMVRFSYQKASFVDTIS